MKVLGILVILVFVWGFMLCGCESTAGANMKKSGVESHSDCKADFVKKDMILYKHPQRYSGFPLIHKGEGNRLWVRFGWNTTASHYGVAAGGESGKITMYSPDGGENWYQQGKDEEFVEVPDDWRGFNLSDGTIVGAKWLMHEVLPASKKAELRRRGIEYRQWEDGHISACYRVRVWRKEPGSAKCEKRYLEIGRELPDVAVIAGFGMGCALADDTVLVPFYGRRNAGDELLRSWVLRSADKGKSWELLEMAERDDLSFGEAEVLGVGDGRVISMIRVETDARKNFLWQTFSEDGGRTWSEPWQTDIWGYPPNLLLLDNGDVLCTYGYRRRPYGIRACFSHDRGRSWDVGNIIVLRKDGLLDGYRHGNLRSADLGYPRTVQLSDGMLFTVYYFTEEDGVTHIAATKWSPEDN